MALAWINGIPTGRPLSDEEPGGFCPPSGLAARFGAVRRRSLLLAEPLSIEDMIPQADPDCSPVKWHLAHTTWFFDRLVLRARGWSPAPAGRFDEVCNSYYVSLGPRSRRDARGLLSRPGVAEVLAYRQQVDEAMERACAAAAEDPALAALIELGLHHEEQHQELLLADVLALFALNPLAPGYLPAPAQEPAASPPPPLRFAPCKGGLQELGALAHGFAFDNERPRHRTYLAPFALADRLISNAEWQAFVEDGGYRAPHLWLSDGWAAVEARGWTGPAYWRERDGELLEFSLLGERPRLPQAPVRHISFYEAEAFARWAGKRLPTEAELELAGPDPAGEGFATLADLARALIEPQPGAGVWQWTASAYRPYPGFQPLEGPAAEYNGKFMSNQMVLKGACFATPRGHARRTYRNFYYPHQRWMFSGVRLAEG